MHGRAKILMILNALMVQKIKIKVKTIKELRIM